MICCNTPDADGLKLQVMKLLETGVVTPYHGQIFELEQVKEAVEHTRKSARGGKAYLKG